MSDGAFRRWLERAAIWCRQMDSSRGLLLGLILNLTLPDRRTAPGVSEGAVTVPWVERRVWGHETSRSRQTDRASSGGIE